MGEAAAAVDRGADVRLAGPVSAAEQGPGEERAVVGGVRPVGHDPPDAQPAGAQGSGCRVPLPTGRMIRLMGQSLSAFAVSIMTLSAAAETPSLPSGPVKGVVTHGRVL